MGLFLIFCHSVLLHFYFLPKKRDFTLGPFKCYCVRFHLSFKYFTIFLFLILSFNHTSLLHVTWRISQMHQSNKNKIKQNNVRLAVFAKWLKIESVFPGLVSKYQLHTHKIKDKKEKELISALVSHSSIYFYTCWDSQIKNYWMY